MTDISLAIHLDRFMRRLHYDITKRAKEFDVDKVGAGGAMLLLTLDEIGTAPLHVLAERLVRDKSQLTREVASLERKGMVSKAPCPVDARSSLLSLTDKGRAMVELHQAEVAQALDAMLGGLTEAEKAVLEDLLARASA